MFDIVQKSCYIIDNKGENMSNTEKKYTNIINSNLFIDKVLEGLGVDKSYVGYYFLLDIMDLLINHNIAVRSFSKEIYPIIANKYENNVASVERDIRNFIDKNWRNKMRGELLPFWYSDTKPTCCKFIYIIKSYILTKIA